MLIDLKKIDRSINLKSDICIVGAGAAGITMALEFLDTGHNVLLMESGGFNFNAKTQSLYDGKIIGMPYGQFTLESSRLRYYGGSTNHWGGWVAPLDKIDFEKRESIPMTGWPVTLDEMQPYYSRAQQYLANHSFDFDNLDKWVNGIHMPLPFSKKQIISKLYEIMPTRFGPKYHESLTQARNITVCLHANLTNIELTGEKNSVKQLRFSSLNNTSATVGARVYILACGGIENARRLLLTGKDGNFAIGNRYGLVGEYFMDHPHVPAGKLYISEPNYNRLSLYYPPNPTKYNYEYLAALRLPDELEKRKNLGNVHILIRSLYSYMYQTNSLEAIWALGDLIKNTHYGESTHVDMDLKKIIKDFDKLLFELNQKILQDPSVNLENYYTLYTRSEQQPNPLSKIILNRSFDSLGQNEVDLDWHLTSHDKKSIREAMLILASEFGRTGIGRVQLFDWLLQDDNYWSDNMTGWCHHMGTTRMNNNPKEGVVDQNCQVHDVPNLYISSSSVFPTSGASNPTFTIIALAIRLSDFLKNKLI